MYLYIQGPEDNLRLESSEAGSSYDYCYCYYYYYYYY